MRLTRPHVFCTNWSDASGMPKAGVLVPVPDSTYPRAAFFDTWDEAMAWANRYAALYAALYAKHRGRTPT